MSIAIDDGLRRARELGSADRWLAVLATRRPDRTDPDIAVVNAGLLPHPADGRPVLGFVARPGRKVDNLRAHPVATLVFRSGWEWVAARGGVELAGPDDPNEHVGTDLLARLRRDIFHAAGGHHPDMELYDRVMSAERRVVVLVDPERFWSNPPGSEHREPQEAPTP